MNRTMTRPCLQHIHPRFSQRQVVPVIEELQERIVELQSEVDSLKPKSSVVN